MGMRLGNEKLFIQLLVHLMLAAAAAPMIAKPGCQDTCGDLSIPYPFGTSEDCYLDDAFFINCTSTDTPYLRYGNMEVLNISLHDALVRALGPLAGYDCYDKQKELVSYLDTRITLSEFYSISSSINKFVAVGCDTRATFQGKMDPDDYDYFTGCTSYCYSNNSIVNGTCSGVGCCQLSIPQGARGFNASLTSFNNHSNVFSYNPCSYVFAVEDGHYNFSSIDLSDAEFQNRNFPMSFDWSIGQTTCAQAKTNSTYACIDLNSECIDSDKRPGYLCKCSLGYRGNPYLSDGCKDIDECLDLSSRNQCISPSNCVNTVGNYTCICPEDYHGDGRRDGSSCIPNPAKPILIKSNTPKSLEIIVGGSIALSVLFVVILIGMCAIRKKEINKLKENNFKENGGLMLQQLLSKVERSEEKAKIFTENELNKATKNFNASGIIGQGAFGTVYEGILENKTLVAIKKSKVMDHGQVEQFVNEVIVLSRIKHPNVVKLLGCCLETPVPLLVYEFITNNTLQHHLHNTVNGSSMSWETRLDIAVQTADALAHMHSDAPIHIIHRDIKSANILLDHNFQAKVSDFGVSRLVPLDQAQLSTMVLGTLGYIDPEYYNSGLLNDKSDVYSFGVVLAELLTGKKVLCPCPNEPQKEKHIAGLLISSIKQDKLCEILDQGVKSEGHQEQLEGVANLARRCMRFKGEKRPTMKQVKMELEGLRRHKRCVVEIGVDIEEAEALLGQPETGYTFIDSTNYQAPMELESGR